MNPDKETKNFVIQISRNNIIQDFHIETDKATIGRAPHCDVSLPNNKYLSKHHVTLHIDKQLQEIKLEVFSNNGILLNDEVYNKSQIVPLTTKDKVYLVHQANDDSNDIILTCNFTQSNTFDNDDDTDNTLEYDFEEEEQLEQEEKCNEVANAKKRKISKYDDTQCTSKFPRLNSDDVSVKPSESCKQITKTVNMKENMLCSICQDIFHDCVSCLPCMHSYCGGCFSEWKDQSSQCPTCRKQVASVNKNHTLNNLSAAYLQMHPELQRSEGELEELNKKNVFKDQDNYPIAPFLSDESSLDSSDASLQDEEDGGFVISSAIPSVRTCRECPNARSLALLPNTGHTCSSDSYHLICSCCNQLFPSGLDNSLKKCVSCTLFFCHMYWQCGKPGCRGCINHIKDLNFEQVTMSSLISKNSYESEILKDYLTSKNICYSDFKASCMEKLEEGAFRVLIGATRLTPDTVLCYRCGLQQIKELAFQYRKAIPSDQLPVHVTSREDCHWGRNCRTQEHSMHHARRFNHVCNQTRFR